MRGKWLRRLIVRRQRGVASVTSALLASVAITAVWRAPAQTGPDPLPSWNEGVAKSTIRSFVARVINETDSDYVPPADRIAVFDNDGTLWCEQPVYMQAAFAYAEVVRRVRAEPALGNKQPYKAIIESDPRALAATGERGVAEIIAATHSGMSTTEFDTAVSRWITTARHPRFGVLYGDLAYQPMLELLGFLRANGFKTYIVSGGGVDFLRVWAPHVYGVPPEQMIGSGGKVAFEIRDDIPRLRRLPALDLVDDGPGKAVGIHKIIGQQPILAFGNSDGDLQMLQYTDAGTRPRLLLLLHHDDAQREYSYDRASKIGRLDKALDEARTRAWTVVSMKNDWAVVFPPH